jgi:acyl-coenzyme A thioesterase PaaI-like protein
MNAADALAMMPYARFLGVEVHASDSGTLFVLPFRDALVGNRWLPALHGGVVGAFLELVATGELFTQTEPGRVPKPIDFNIDFLRSVGPRATHGKATIVKHGRRIANVRVIAWQLDENKPVATGTGNFLL